MSIFTGMTAPGRVGGAQRYPPLARLSEHYGLESRTNAGGRNFQLELMRANANQARKNPCPSVLICGKNLLNWLDSL
jgi:hypothetical protein